MSNVPTIWISTWLLSLPSTLSQEKTDHISNSTIFFSYDSILLSHNFLRLDREPWTVGDTWHVESSGPPLNRSRTNTGYTAHVRGKTNKLYIFFGLFTFFGKIWQDKLFGVTFFSAINKSFWKSLNWWFSWRYFDAKIEVTTSEIYCKNKL